MFAVPGWSVSADKLKPESADGPNAARQGESNSKKRKRQQAATNTTVTSSNVADLWEQVIEGNSKKKKKQRKEKGPKPDADGEARDGSNQREAVTDDPVSDDATPKLSRKEKKLLNKQKLAEEAANKTYQDPVDQPGEDEGISSTPNQALSGKKDKKKDKKKSRNVDNEGGDAYGSKQAEEKPKTGSKQGVQVQPPPAAAPKLTPLQASMREKLVSARFRHLNETLYTKPSADAFQLFQDSPEMFQEYHEGFRRQVGVWPENPVDGYVADILRRARQRTPHKSSKPSDAGAAAAPLPRTNGTCRIADLGCGDAKIATALQSEQKKLRLQMLSYDLQSPSPLVTRADIANLPLEEGSVNVAIFCLALMGTNWLDFVEEAYRILHWKGELWVAEIKSRFGPVGGAKKGGPGQVVSHSVGNRKKMSKKTKAGGEDGEDGDHATDLAVEVDGADDQRQETDVQAFVEALRKRGFGLQGRPDLNNKMFVRMHFVKAAAPSVGKCADPATTPAPSAAAAAPGGGPRDRRQNNQRNGAKSRFVDKAGDAADEAATEGRILKPCVYKIR